MDPTTLDPGKLHTRVEPHGMPAIPPHAATLVHCQCHRELPPFADHRFAAALCGAISGGVGATA